MYRAHCAVMFAIAQLSCLVFLLTRKQRKKQRNRSKTIPRPANNRVVCLLISIRFIYHSAWLPPPTHRDIAISPCDSITNCPLAAYRFTLGSAARLYHWGTAARWRTLFLSSATVALLGVVYWRHNNTLVSQFIQRCNTLIYCSRWTR